MQVLIVMSPKAEKLINMVKSAIRNSPTGVSFFSVQHYVNQSGEEATHTFNIGASYDKAKAKDIQFLKNLDVLTLTDCVSSKVLLEQARVKLLDAFLSPNKTASFAQQDAYTHIASGVKVHNETGKLYIYGLRVNKVIHKEGVYEKTNKKPLTIAQDEIKKHLKTAQFRQFIVSECEGVKGNGQTIEIY